MNSTPQPQERQFEGLIVKESEKKGRYLVAKRGFKAGDLVLSSEPVACCVKWCLRDDYCDYCMRRRPTTHPLRHCSGCKLVCYCDEKCQSLAWKLYHKFECKIMKTDQEFAENLSETTLDEVRLACRILQNKADPRYAGVLSLVSHRDEIVANDSIRREGVSKESDLVIARMRGRNSTSNSKIEAEETIYRIQCNGFTVWDSVIVPIGGGIFPSGALLNHSCDPTCVVSFKYESGKLPVLELRCSKDLNEGDELTHCYTDLASRSDSRRNELQLQYLFTCDCSRCLNVDQSKELDSHLSGIRERNTESEEQLKIAAVLHETANDPRIDVKESKEMFIKACEIRKKWLDPLNLDLMSSCSHAMTTCLEDEDWNGSIYFALHVLSVYRIVYPHNHPMLGLHLYTLGDILEKVGKHDEGRIAHQEALEILKITHGTNHTFVTDLIEILKK